MWRWNIFNSITVSLKGEMKWKTGGKFLSSKCNVCVDDDSYSCFFHTICYMSVSKILVQT